MTSASAQLAEVLNPSARSAMAARGYLARYKGKTLKTYEVSLRIFFRFMLAHRVDPLNAIRPHIELFMRVHLEEERGNQASSVHHHMSVVRGFYKFAQLDDYIDKDPTFGVLLPKVFVDEWRQDWLSRAELQLMLAAAEASERPSETGLVAMLALLGLRIDECLRVQIGDYSDVLLGHRVLRLIGKGGKPATIPLPAAVVRLFDRAAGGRRGGHLLVRETSSVRALVGTPLTYGAARVALERVRKAAGKERAVAPHMFRRGVITAGLDQGISVRNMQILARHSDPRTTSRYDRGVQNLDGHAVHLLAANLAGGG